MSSDPLCFVRDVIVSIQPQRNLTGIVLTWLHNKALLLLSNKFIEKHTQEMLSWYQRYLYEWTLAHCSKWRGQRTGNKAIDGAICVTEWLLANNDICSNIIHRGLGDHWKFRRGTPPRVDEWSRETTLISSYRQEGKHYTTSCDIQWWKRYSDTWLK